MSRRFVFSRLALITIVLLCGGVAAHAQDAGAPPAKKKVVFLPGEQSHGWSGHAYTADCKLLAHILNENVPAVQAVVLEGGWPKDTSALDGAAALVIACDGNSLLGRESKWKALDALAKSLSH